MEAERQPSRARAPEGDRDDLKWALEDPVAFARVILRHDLWRRQEEILRAVRPGSRVAVKACHASGKTFLAADAVLWWITRFPDGIAVTTAPTWTQVERLLWGAIHRAAGGSMISYPPLNQTELRLGPDNYAMGLSTNEGVRFQGFHGRVLIVIDEAPGVRPEIWEAIEGIRASGSVCVLALGNPTIASGPFYDAFASARAAWETFTISAFDTPNFAGIDRERLVGLAEAELDTNVRDYLVGRRWVLEKWREWGERHPLWQSRVMGDFPTESEDALFPLAWLEAARDRKIEEPDGAEWVAGLDVAGPGEDETSLAVRHGSTVVFQQSWSKPDPRGDVVAALAKFKERGIRVNVDVCGLGHYFLLGLKDAGFKTKRVNVGERPANRERYANLKAEVYWGFRQRLETGDVAGLSDEASVAQLAGVRYAHNARGQVVIEGKDEMRKRGVRSPDRGEAIILAFGASRRLKPVNIMDTIHIF